MPASTKISVASAGKVGDGVNAYHVYPITSTPANEPLTVDRRYSDFLWLHHQVWARPVKACQYQFERI